MAGGGRPLAAAQAMAALGALTLTPSLTLTLTRTLTITLTPTLTLTLTPTLTLTQAMVALGGEGILLERRVWVLGALCVAAPLAYMQKITALRHT